GSERVLVSSGTVLSGARVRVVDADGRACEASQIGELQLQADFLMRDYLDADAAVRARAWSSDGWYRTGDLGAMLDGELYVTGRKKDLVIVGGVNVFPEDIEAALAELPSLRAGRAVALGVFDERLGTERLVIVAEVAL